MYAWKWGGVLSGDLHPALFFGPDDFDNDGLRNHLSH
jgi:hypothetical protein